MIWWINQPTRALDEKAEIVALAERVPWLVNIGWSHDFPTLKVNFELIVGDKPIALTLIYEQLFPEFPARIVVQDGVLLSGHQYGPKGELCLEWRTDNWQPDITGAMLIESAYRLLSTEKQEGKFVASAHQLTLGQRVRKSSGRFLISKDVKAALARLPESSRTEATFLEHRFAETWIAELITVGSDTARVWEGSATFTADRAKYGASVLRQPQPEGSVNRAWLEAVLGEDFDQWKVAYPSGHFIVANVSGVQLYQLLEESVYPYQTVDLPSPEERLDSSHATLAGKRVGIVGCGSVGSKVAASLARSGVDSFLLVDSDIVFKENIVRNELNLRAIGVNKTSAVKQTIIEIKPDAVIEKQDVLLGRQESSAWSLSAALKLSKCDIIIDATADINAFGVISAIAQAYSKTMIWGRVYEGGLGGLIARARPDLDPVPQAARRQIDGWFQQKGVPWTASAETRNYASVADGPPIIATDCDVGVVALNIARFALDALLHPTDSTFPFSVYALGFSSAWIFDCPFDVWPIALLPEGKWGVQQEENRDETLGKMIKEFFPDDAANGKS